MECYALISVAKKKFQRSREVNTYISDRAIDKFKKKFLLIPRPGGKQAAARCWRCSLLCCNENITFLTCSIRQQIKYNKTLI